MTYYVITVFTVVSGLYYFVVMLQLHDFTLILGITFVITGLMGLLMATLALEPLREHFNHLERFTKETLHELNLPINTITANTNMLQKNTTDEKSIKRIQRIEMAAKMLQERYEELNYLIQKQMHKETIETFELSHVISERIDFLSSLYSRFDFEKNLQMTDISSDRWGLLKVIDNLIENAVKYSSDSRNIRIVLKDAILEIIDYGDGMDEVELLHIFDRYYQNDATMPGFGIGLGLVKSYCDRYKIDLHVKSKKHKGTTVSLNFKEVKI
ncbi:MAG: HAMP domain-containing sensor histidine kinase [Campylobacterota bacterium]|nr:HAMP domain-containing sensor histidine kinase [Campylobacterota bacterium]